ncbi:outer membrane lipoprotein-sorting protein [Cyclonatronum proteinivorum]|uniref:Outer membrane lipoprotein-sorting protein n=1 Tax=Cyclonatronum proteinivorum TaxID=1457365 RepID=A0A345UG22_9BACT|nr:outer membrane lipoprotein-sorting protein [Cyclonatronum proteinivorum]AXI99423.1 outer membrane lipoprotein-sorting protein [Cyclonatronum proteinivorum]
MKTIVLISFLLVGLLQTAAAQDVNPKEIIRQMDETMRGESSFAEMTMTIERPRYTREVSIRSWSLGNTHSMILITAPARDEGTTFLKRDNEIWNFVPSVDRTIRMPPSMMAQSWMGSDFTNDDLVRDTSPVNDFTHELLREETVDGRQAWVIKMTPDPDAPIVWGHVLMWVCQQDFIQLRTENFDQRGELAQTLVFSDIRKLGGRTLPARITVQPADRNQKTTLQYRELRFGISEGEDFFTQRNMQRMR